ncbi:MAG: DEAD/DEAH box helicase family protein [Treponema sp.]|nr:DEAD/DEAH box helicase family protein [Treponema sp.]
MGGHIKKLNSAQIISSLCEGGDVANKLSSYELRQSQLDLLELIIQAFNEDALLMAEAGTGVGKSFAYLLPAIYFAHETKEKTVISTATITLQQQLFNKDIPLVASAMDKPVKAVLMKGRGNYLCLRRLDDAQREPPLDPNEHNDFQRIVEWAKTTKTGDRSELSFMPLESIWSHTCSESDLCMGSHCPYMEKCFILKLRKEANSAHIIVVNHHLLFADLAARSQGAGYEQTVVLPPFTRLVIDEAHTIENAASSFFSASFSRIGIFRQLSRLYSQRRGSLRGLLVRLCALLPTNFDLIDNLADAVQKARARTEELETCALQFCSADGIFRLSPALDEEIFKQSLFPHLKSLRKELLSLVNMVRDITENLDDEAAADPTAWEVKRIVKRLEDTANICDVFCKYKKHENDVLWMERNIFGSAPWVTFTRTPLDLSPKLKESVFAPCKTAVCVSATLAINEDFSYWASRCGINDLETRTVLSGCFPSPFPYSKAVLLASPADAPLPDEEGYQDFVNMAAGKLAGIAGGSALILFTSYQSLTSAYNAAKEELESIGIRCLKQGDDDRARLLSTFVSETSACLFATDSFWEGVDAPGDALRLVIICRLPFRTPGDPVFEARREAVQKRGGNPFVELSLPQAVMKFKQGFGRLMRRSDDHGVVVVLDSRIIKKQYGSLFLHSLPETKTSFGSFEKILQDVEGFLY